MNFKRETVDVKGHNVEFITIQTNEQNSLTRASLLELQEIFEEIKHNDAIKAVVLTSENEKFFSNGVDAATIAKVSNDKLPEEMGEIVVFFNYLLSFYKPLFAEVCGHAMGGGAVLTVASDFKYMLHQKGRISFTEVFFGLPLPGSFIDKIRITVAPGKINDVIYGGVYKADEAKQIQMVDDIAPTREELRKILMKKLSTIVTIPTSAYAGTKKALHHDLVKNLEHHTQGLFDTFQDPTIRGNLMEAMNAFGEKRRPNFK